MATTPDSDDERWPRLPAERATADYDALGLDCLPAHLRRNSLDYYYLSVWPGLRDLDLIDAEGAPARVGPVRAAYVHLPFCSGLCDFCSYFVVVSRRHATDPRISEHVDHLLLEVDLHQERADLQFAYLYLGGGTPSLLSPDDMTRLLGGLKRRGALAEAMLGTVELHPEFFEDRQRADEFLDALQAHGVNRVSIGFQSADPGLLAATNRRHGPEFARAAVEYLHKRGFLLNLDLMYGLPGQSLNSWIASLDTALELAADSYSTYFTFVDPGTKMSNDVRRGHVTLADHRLVQTQHLAARLMLEAAGFFELPNDFWSRPVGDPRDYIQDTLPSDANTVALGAGAYGHYSNFQYFNEFSLSGYRQRLRARELPVWRGALLTAAQQRARDIMFSFKNDPYLSVALYERRHGVSPLEAFEPVFDSLRNLALVDVDADRLRLTAKGRLLVEEIACMFGRVTDGGDASRQAPRDVRLERHHFAPRYSAR